MPEKCPYADLDLGNGIVRCNKLHDLCGSYVSVHARICKAHWAAGGPDVPLEQVPRLAKVITLALRSRIVAGDCPRYQLANPVDIETAAAKLRARCSKAELEEIWLEAIDHWAAVTEDKGGHPPQTVEEKGRRLAELWEIDIREGIPLEPESPD